jgi:hypothetical protein
MINRIEGGTLVQQSKDDSFTSIKSNQKIIQDQGWISSTVESQGPASSHQEIHQ